MTTFLDFQPHCCFLGGHLQTLAGFYWPERLPPYAATRIPVDVSDGDQIVLHEDMPAGWTRTDPTALLIHGLAGCHGSPYMVRLTTRLTECGIRCYRMDMRGCGAASGKAKLPGHAGRFADVVAAVETIARRCPDAPLTIVGFSMGGNLALHAMAEASVSQIGNLCSGIAVAPPVDLARCCHELRQGWRRCYDRYLVKRLITSWQRTGGTLPDKTPQSIYEFDDTITAPVSGYRDAEHYYAEASSGPRLTEIQLPTKILAARDDPLVATVAVESVARSPSVELFLTESGGHLGFMGYREHAPRGRWMDQQLVDWVTTMNVIPCKRPTDALNDIAK